MWFKVPKNCRLWFVVVRSNESHYEWFSVPSVVSRNQFLHFLDHYSNLVSAVDWNGRYESVHEEGADGYEPLVEGIEPTRLKLVDDELEIDG